MQQPNELHNESGSRYAESAFYAARAAQRQGDSQRTTALVSQAVQQHGDNPAAGDFEKLLALAHHHRIDSRSLIAAEHGQKTGTPQSRKKIIQSPAGESYAQWLQRGAASARRNSQPTLVSRFEFALSEHYRRNRQSDLQQAMLLQIAHETPPARLDTRTLEQVCQLLSEKDFASAKQSLEELSARYRAASPPPAAIQWSQAQQSLHHGNAEEALEQLNRLGADWPTHPLLPQALELQAGIYAETDRAEEAAERLLSLLQLPASTPEQRTAALLTLARQHAAAGQPAEAIAYYQRLYTLYRADPQALQAAYLESAALFEALGQSNAAKATYAELLSSLGTRLAPQQRARIEALLNAETPQEAGYPPPPALQQRLLHQPPHQPTTGQTVSAAQLLAIESISAEILTPKAAATPTAHSLLPTTAVTAQTAAKMPPATPLQATPVVSSSASPAVAAAATPAAEQQDENPWQAQPVRAARLFLIHGAQLEGDIIGTQNGQLHLRLRQAGNRIGETAVPLERIAQIDFADASLWQQADTWQTAGESGRAYAARKQLYFIRENALTFSRDSETLNRFAALATDALARGEPLLAARIGSRCAQLLQGNMAARSTATGDPEAALATHFGDTELLALWQMGLRNQAAQRALEQLTQRAELATAGIFSEAKQTAQEQHTQQPQLPLQYWKHPASALPYAVLAAQALDTSQTEYALELALQPIVFARQGKAQQLPHLAAAYAQAITAATARDDAAYAETLQQEALEHSVNIAAHALRGSGAQQP